MFEKYDGVRGFWNPQTKAFYSRKGNRFIFPPEIIKAMPSDVFLDGELWLLPSSPPKLTNLSYRFGRDSFQEAMKIAHRSNETQLDWKRFKYMVFDAPTHSGTYQERYKYLGTLYLPPGIQY